MTDIAVPNRSRRAVSIRTLLYGAVIGLSALSLGGLGSRVMSDFGELRDAHAAQEADIGANRYTAGLFEVLMERLETNNALQAADPAGAEVLQGIAKRRAAVAANFAPGLAELSQHAFPSKAALLRDLRTAQEAADGLRQRADAALKLPRDQRDAALRRDFVPGITASVNAALGVWFAAAHAVAQADPGLARLAIVKEIGWRLRDTAGFERSNVSSAIASQQPMRAELVAVNAGIRARVDMLWDQFSNLAPLADPGTHPALRAAVEVAKRDYFQGFRPLADQMVKAGAEGSYPMPVAQFVETTTAQLGTLLEVMHAAGRASEAHVQEMVAKTRQDAMMSLGILGVVLVVAAGSLWLVTRRVVGPLRSLSATTARLAAGDLTADVAEAGRGDEVGAVADAVLLVREGARKARTEEAEAAAARAQVDRERRHEAMRTMAGELETALGGIATTLTESAVGLQRSADSLTQGADAAAQDSAAAAGDTTHASANVQAVAAASEEMASSVEEISRRVRRRPRWRSRPPARLRPPMRRCVHCPRGRRGSARWCG